LRPLGLPLNSYYALQDVPAVPTRRSSDLGEHLHHPLDLLLPTDHRVELALPGGLGQVAAELVEHQRGGGCGLAATGAGRGRLLRSEEHTSELQSRENLVCRLLLEKKKRRT